MSTHDAHDLEDLNLAETPDFMTAMTSPDFRHYVEEDATEEIELGLRALFENPEALSRSFRRQAGGRGKARIRWRTRAHV